MKFIPNLMMAGLVLLAVGPAMAATNVGASEAKILMPFVLASNSLEFAQDSEGIPEKAGAGKLKKLDTDGDGQVSLDEFLAQAEKRFGKMDTDEDGHISPAEFKEGRKAIHTKSRERRERRQGKRDSE